MATTQTATSPNRIKLSRVRLSYPQLFEPKAAKFDGKDGPPKYSCTVILDKKKDAEQIKAVQELIERLMTEKWGKKDKRSSKLHNPLREGSEKNGKKGYGPDVMFINCSANTDHKPEVVDAIKDGSGNLVRLTKADGRPYAGCFVNISINFFTFDPAVNKGVGAGLGNVQFAGHGDRLGGGESADNEFDEEEIEENNLLD